MDRAGFGISYLVIGRVTDSIWMPNTILQARICIGKTEKVSLRRKTSVFLNEKFVLIKNQEKRCSKN